MPSMRLTSVKPTRTVALAYAVAVPVLVLSVIGCGADDDGSAGVSPSSNGGVESSTSPPSPSGGTPEPTQEPESEPVTTLTGAPFSGYRGVEQEVVGWRLTCPPDFAEPVPDAVTMGTASRDLADRTAQAVRQVAIFADVGAAVAAADALGAQARDSCAGEYEPMDDFVASRTTVQTLEVGAQGVVLDTTAEDSTSSTAVFRRGNAVALVAVSKGAVAAQDVDPAVLARQGATELFVQLCAYDQSGC